MRFVAFVAAVVFAGPVMAQPFAFQSDKAVSNLNSPHPCLDALWSVPQIIPILPNSGFAFDEKLPIPGSFKCSPRDDLLPMREGGEGCDNGLKLQEIKRFRFEKPAHFPLLRFGPQGEPIELEGAMIYEGMRLSVYTHGVYELAFALQCQVQPVEVRLSFKVLSEPVSHENGKDVRYPPREAQITIPPIRIAPDYNNPSRKMGSAWLVRHRGYSMALENCGPMEIERVGIARFGYQASQIRGLYD